jgi:pimeloyl-ACP methyl ester carboxylesterase
MTTDSPGLEHRADETDPRPPDSHARCGNRPRRRRRIIAITTLLAIIGVLLGNAVVVTRQDAEASGAARLRLDAGNIFVSQDGPRDAPALVLIHGLGGSTRWWDALVPMLARSHRVIRIDLLGHGQSAKPAGDGYAIPLQGARVGAALEQLGVRHAIVVGHSTGGSVATALTEQRPGLVTALALIDTGPRPDAFISNGLAGQLMFTPIVGQLFWQVRTDGLLRRSLGTGFSRPGYEIPQQLVDDVRGTTYHAFTATSAAADAYLTQRALPDRLTSIGKPLLVIFGQDDRRWRSSSASDYRAVPATTVEVLPGVGHSPMLEDPSRTAALLLQFTANHTP